MATVLSVLLIFWDGRGVSYRAILLSEVATSSNAVHFADSSFHPFLDSSMMLLPTCV